MTLLILNSSEIDTKTLSLKLAHSKHPEFFIAESDKSRDENENSRLRHKERMVTSQNIVIPQICGDA